MSVIDLKKRQTNDWDEMHKHLSSPDSMVYMDNVHNDANCSTSIDLNVGNAYIIPGSNHTFSISEKDGLNVKPHRSVVIYTKQRIKLPYNVFGVVTGKGLFIFKGCFLSTGKIDPAFDGHLKIGFYNGSNTSIRLRRGDAFATACFFNTDGTLTAPLKQYQTELSPDLPKIQIYQRVWMFIKEKWITFLAWAIIAVPTALLYMSQFLALLKGWLSQK